jgi:hypothetical protein
MMLASGEYLRFLDDDDYLLPQAVQQISTIVEEQADVCSGVIVSVDKNGETLGRTSFPTTKDFTMAALSLTGFALPTGHLYRRAAVSDCRWDERLDVLQDRGWLLSLVSLRDLTWVRIECEVGVWFQHGSIRTSTNSPSRAKNELIVHKLSMLPKLLVIQNRVNENRLAAISQALWDYAHRGFPYHPIYWTIIILNAMKIDSREKVRHPLYDFLSTGPRTAIILEWLLIPARHVARLFRALRALKSDTRHRRSI